MVGDHPSRRDVLAAPPYPSPVAGPAADRHHLREEPRASARTHGSVRGAGRKARPYRDRLKNQRRRVQRTLKRINEALRRRIHADLWAAGTWLGRVISGWLNCYAVPGSMQSLRRFLWTLH